MIELPEAFTLATQLNQAFVGKTIVGCAANTSPHSFAWYSGDPALYNEKLAGRKITGTAAHGGRTELHADGMIISFLDGVRFHCFGAGEKRPDKHQFLLEFDNGTGFCCTVQMYGGMLTFPDEPSGDFYYNAAKEKPSPYSDAFDGDYFELLRRGIKQKLSVKAFLATEQRIPGFGNGVLHDVLWNAHIHPKRKLETLTDSDMKSLFDSVKSTLADMRDGGGRDTERDLFGRPGGYRTVLSSKTLAYPCPACGGGLRREAYLGGNIYFCPDCQPLGGGC